ncbi:MAG: hypothetical protein IKS82_04480 [Bacteroidales bacterium]|nr:hypothetical protein [Bacteroidales bacterium]
MKRFAAFIVMLLASAMAFAQNPEQIKNNPEMIWAEGSTQKEALDGITSKLAHAVGFTCPKSKFLSLMKTYSQDIRKYTHQITYNGRFLRYISVSETEKIFSSRRQKIAELKQSARSLQSSGPKDAATLYRWALIYLKSLPGDNSRESSSLQGSINAIQKKQGQTSASSGIQTRMAHIDRETRQIAGILGEPMPEIKNVPVSEPKPLNAQIPDAGVKRTDLTPIQNVGVSQDVDAFVNGKAIPEDKQFERMKFISMLSGTGIKLDNYSQNNNNTGKVASLWVTPTGHWNRAVILLQAGFSPEFITGIMAGYNIRTAGFYASYKSNFTSVSSDGEILSSISPSELSANNKVSLSMITGGLLYSLARSYPPEWLKNGRTNTMLYAGAGYGQRTVYWQDKSENWAKVTDRTSSGVAVEAGVIYSFLNTSARNLSLSAGINTINFKTLGFTIGIGVNFK